MSNRKSDIDSKRTLSIMMLIVLVTFVAGVIAYPELPNQVASHWNANGAVDGTSSRFWGLFTMPLIELAIVFLYWLIPRIDPRAKNIKKFYSYFGRFMIVITVFLSYVFALTLWWNLYGQFDMTIFINLGLAFLIWEAGTLISHSKPNWFIGIRTPWTLSDDEVWAKTHALAAKLFQVAAIVTALAAMLASGAISLGLGVGAILLAAIVPVFYSYFAYKNRGK